MCRRARERPPVQRALRLEDEARPPQPLPPRAGRLGPGRQGACPSHRGPAPHLRALRSSAGEAPPEKAPEGVHGALSPVRRRPHSRLCLGVHGVPAEGPCADAPVPGPACVPAALGAPAAFSSLRYFSIEARKAPSSVFTTAPASSPRWTWRGSHRVAPGSLVAAPGCSTPGLIRGALPSSLHTQRRPGGATRGHPPPRCLTPTLLKTLACQKGRGV